MPQIFPAFTELSIILNALAYHKPVYASPNPAFMIVQYTLSILAPFFYAFVGYRLLRGDKNPWYFRAGFALLLVQVLIFIAIAILFSQISILKTMP